MSKVSNILVVLLMLVVSRPAGSQEATNYAGDLQRLVQDVRDLQRFVYSGRVAGKPEKPGLALSEKPLSADAVTLLHLKMQTLENQISSLTGRLEEIENSLLGVRDRLKRLISDVDLRLRAIEMKTGVVQSFDNQKGPEKPEILAQADAGLKPGQKLLGTISPGETDKIIPIDDKPRSGASINSDPVQSKYRKSSIENQTNTSVSNGLRRGKVLPDGTPKQQYLHAFDLLKKRDFVNAARSLRAFVEKNPKHELAGNAMYWLGETYYDQQKYAKAARIFLDGYRRYPKSKKAPDNLLKLGKALNSVGEKKSACATWSKLLRDYPKAGTRLLRNAQNSVKRNKCS